MGGTTLFHARRLGAGAILVRGDGSRYKISDWSMGTGAVFGHPVKRDGTLGTYRQIPPNLLPEKEKADGPAIPLV